MAFAGAVLFALIFLLMGSATRGAVSASLGRAGDWFVAWAPFSFLIVFAVLVAPVASYILMKRWPTIPEPENPMARYKNADDVIYD